MSLTQRPRVCWVGDFYSGFSLATVNRRLVRALVRRGNVDICIRTDPAVAEFVPPEFREFVELAHREIGNPDITIVNALTTFRYGVPPGSRYVRYLPWEYGSMPVEWFEALRDECDNVWVPCTANRNDFVFDGFPHDLVTVVPYGVDTGVFRTRLATSGQVSPFRFLYVGATIPRKGIDVMVNAYFRAFRPTDHVVLTIKDVNAHSFYKATAQGQDIQALTQIPELPRMEYIDVTIPDELMPELFHAADCLVLPYRGEGFGMPVLEAMACGLPVIVTAGGATDDFVDETVGWRIPSERRDCAPGTPVPTMSTAWLLEPDIDALANLMRYAFEHRDETRARGVNAARKASTWTWDQAAAIAEKCFLEILSRRPAPSDGRNARYHSASVYEDQRTSSSRLDGVILEVFRRLTVDEPQFVELNADGNVALASVLSIGWRWHGLAVDRATASPAAISSILATGGIRREFDLLVVDRDDACQVLSALDGFRPRVLVCASPSMDAVIDAASRIGYTLVVRESQTGDAMFVRSDLVKRAAFDPVSW